MPSNTNMLKTLTISILGLALLIPAVMAYTDITERVVVEFSYPTNRNLVVLRDGERWLIHYKGRCSKPEAGETVILSVRDSLDSNGDRLKTSDYHVCDIDQAEIIDEVLKVEKIYGGKTHVIVSDEQSRRYLIYFPSSCSNTKGYLNQSIFLRMYGSEVDRADRLFLPRKENQCDLTHVEPLAADASGEDIPISRIAEKKSELAAGNDVKRPSTPGNPRAITGPGRAYVYWYEADDNVEIDHYVVAYSPYSLSTEDLEIEDVLNFVTSETNTAVVPDLQIGKLYFFYIKAVDTSGNASSDWSEEVSATPRKITVIGTPGFNNLYLKIGQKTDKSFLFRWRKDPSIN